MRPSHRLRPTIEGMEPKALLSGVGGGVIGTIVSHTLHLHGTVKGTYNEHQANPDTPKEYNLFGTGDLGLKARTALAGSIHSGGFTTHPNAEGKIYLADARGTITVKLTVDPKAGSTGGLADTYDYTIVGGTGAYKNDTGKGTVVLTLDRTKPPTTTTGPTGKVQHGTFDMVFVG